VLINLPPFVYVVKAQYHVPDVQQLPPPASSTPMPLNAVLQVGRHVS
jgi:hypothetical protein